MKKNLKQSKSATNNKRSNMNKSSNTTNSCRDCSDNERNMDCK